MTLVGRGGLSSGFKHLSWLEMQSRIQFSIRQNAMSESDEISLNRPGIYFSAWLSAASQKMIVYSSGPRAPALYTYHLSCIRE
jgi:hypothetical protein